VAYLVWYPDEGAASISDLLAVDASGTLGLLAAFSNLIRRQRLSAIRFDCFAPADFYCLLRQAGFHRRQNRHPVLCRHRKPTGAAPIQPEPGQNWFLTMADSDTDV
jgi:hypothetical protein